MKRKMIALIVSLVVLAVVSTGCFFSTSTSRTERTEDYVYLDLDIRGEGYVSSLREGENSFSKSSTVDLKARPDDGWEFKQWKGDVRNKYSSSTSILMSSNKDVTAVFERKEDPVQDVSFQSERRGTREYKFVGSKPTNGRYWEWKMPGENYWHGYEDENVFNYKFSSSGEKEVKLRIEDSSGNIIGQTSKTINVY